MAYDEGLAERLREQFQDRHDVEEKKMFGGLCFMVSQHMCCGIVGETLMARVGPDSYEACLQKAYTSEMDFTGKAMKGMVYVAPEGIASDTDLAWWVDTCIAFVESLPPKKPK
ncbi:MAG: TfoX/Sxy family protein [Chromatiales bacterium]|nr:TfoX/Sxy family protein [Chromatiales bacterium]